MPAIAPETAPGAVTVGNTMPSTVVARHIRTKQRPTSTAVPLVAIPFRADRQTPAKTKGKWGAGSRGERRIVAVDNRREAWIAAEAAIELATEAYRRAPVPVPGAAALAELRAAQAEAARGRVVHAALPVWVAPAAAAGGGGNQSMNKEKH